MAVILAHLYRLPRHFLRDIDDKMRFSWLSLVTREMHRMSSIDYSLTVRMILVVDSGVDILSLSLIGLFAVALDQTLGATL